MSQPTERWHRLAAAWLAGLPSERTREAYRGDLDHFVSWLTAQGISSPLDADNSDLAQYRDWIGDMAASATVARRMSALRSFFGYAASVGAIAAAPVPPWSGTAASRSSTIDLDAGDMADLMEAAGRRGSRTAVLLGLMVFDGLRLDEVLAADAGDITFGARRTSIAVERPLGSRMVIVDRWTASALRRYLGSRRDGPLLMGESPTREPSRLTRFGADYLIKRAGALAGLDRLSANTLRRTFVARAHANGTPIEAIRDRLGHRDVRTTRRHLNPN